MIVTYSFLFFFFFQSQKQISTSVCSNVSFNTESKTSHRSSSVRFKDTEFERSDSRRSHPIWRPAYDSDTNSAPHYRTIKPILTPTTGRSSAISTGISPIPANEFERPQKFMLSTEQLSTVARDSQVLKPKAVSACSAASNQPKQFPAQPSHSPQFYTAVSGPPYHNQKHIAESTHGTVKMHESMECSERTMTSSLTRAMFEEQQFQHHQHHQRNTFEIPVEQMSTTFTVSPTPSISRQKLRPPPTPTKFIPGEFRESDYDSEIESIKIRPVWTPNQFSESENAHYRHRHVSPPAPTSSRGRSVPKHHFERILTPMEFDVNAVEMPTQIKCLPSSSPSLGNQSAYQFKTQTLDRFRTKKKIISSQFGSSSQDDINVMHSTPKYCRRSPSLNKSYEQESQSCPTYREESRSSQCGKLAPSYCTVSYFNFIHISAGTNCMVLTLFFLNQPYPKCDTSILFCNHFDFLLKKEKKTI